jgi:hypothetical protein
MQDNPTLTIPTKPAITSKSIADLPRDILTLGKRSFAEAHETYKTCRDSGQPYPSRTPFQFVDEMALALRDYSTNDVLLTIAAPFFMPSGFQTEDAPVPTTAPISGLPFAASA